MFPSISICSIWGGLSLLLLDYSRGDWKTTIKRLWACRHAHTQIPLLSPAITCKNLSWSNRKMSSGYRDHFMSSEFQDLPQNSQLKNLKNLSKLYGTFEFWHHGLLNKSLNKFINYKFHSLSQHSIFYFLM